MAKVDMSKAMPQEIEVWFVIPAIRRELAKIFIKDHKLSQKQAADKLGISEAAISQYLSGKRGSELRFSESEKEKIKESAKKIVDGSNIMEEMYSLVSSLRACESVCSMHKRFDKELPHDCQICMGR